MRRFWTTVLFIITVAGCDVFLDDIGELDQPCSKYDECVGALICLNEVCDYRPEIGETCYTPLDYANPEMYWESREECAPPGLCVGDTCVPAGHDGEMCVPRQHCEDYYYRPTRDYCEDAVFRGDGYCRDGLGCIDGICQEPISDLVAQPGTDLIWRRCPENLPWSGWSCIHSSEDRLFADQLEAITQCASRGMRLPTLDEMVGLLGGESQCAGPLVTEEVSCPTCAESTACTAVFDPNDIDLGRSFWTDTLAIDPEYSSAEYWSLDLAEGTFDWIYDSTERYVLCVKNAP